MFILSFKLSCLCIQLYCFIQVQPASPQIYCKDEQNQPVDWFIAYKLPDSLNYVYVTSNNQNLIRSSNEIGDTKGMFYYTLQPLNSLEDSEALQLFYNDEPADLNTMYFHFWTKHFHNKRAEQSGHMKGVVALGYQSKGFWMIHSAPKYPSPHSHNYPHSATRFGQTFMCVSVNYSQLKVICQQLSLTHPQVYYNSIPKNILKDCPALQDIADNKQIFHSSQTSLKTLMSDGGFEFLQFSKSAFFQKDLYADFIAPNLKSNLYVECWRNGKGNLDSACSTEYKVYNIDDLKVDNQPFSTNQDHAKWGIVDENSTQPWICIASINRQSSQYYRGGEAFCLINKPVHKAFYSMVQRFEPCKIPRYG